MHKTILAIALLTTGCLLFAQQAQNNDSIVKLVKAGMSDDLIVSAINAQPGTYDTSADSLITLKSAGASDKVISAILQKAASAASSAPTPTGQSTPRTTNNADIIKLVQAGYSDDTILSAINEASGGYDVSPDGLAALKRAGVSDKVVAAIRQRAESLVQAEASKTVLSTLAAQDPNDPMALHYVGIYMTTATPDGKGKMVQIKQAASSENLEAGFAPGLSFGLAKAKIQDRIAGAHAAIRTQERSPVFYMYLTSNGYMYDVATTYLEKRAASGAPSNFGSPSQFSLISMEDKKDYREMEVGRLGLGGEKDTLDEKQMIKFNAEQIRPNVFKVTPETALKPGEYAFVAATGLGGVDDSSAPGNWTVLAYRVLAVFDFGVD